MSFFYRAPKRRSVFPAAHRLLVFPGAMLPRSRVAHWILMVAGIAVVLVAAGFLALHFAGRVLKPHVLEALGPESEIGDVRVGFTGIVISDLRVKAPKGWPTDSTLKAGTMTIVPDLRKLVSRQIFISTVRIENGYISAVRPKEGGGLKIVPSMLGEKHKQKAEETGRTGEIRTVELENCRIDLYDATIAGHKRLRVESVHGAVDNIRIPRIAGRSEVDLTGAIAGKVHRGTMHVTGWVDVAGKSSDLKTRVRNVDLALFEPYLIQKTKAGIDEGTFDLDLDSVTRKNEVKAHGRISVNSLKLKEGEGALGGFKSLPERAVIGALSDDSGKIELEFELKGDLDNPAFSLSQGLGLKTATALLKAFGLGFEALIRAFYVLVSGLGSAFG